jgi:hypothetical protein
MAVDGGDDVAAAGIAALAVAGRGCSYCWQNCSLLLLKL